MLTQKLYFEDRLSYIGQERVDAVCESVKKETETIGYYSLPEGSSELLDKIYEYILKNELISKKKLKNIVVLGIGGSSLGSRAIDEALNHLKQRSQIKLTFLENCDPIMVTKQLANIELKNSLFLMISKSGGTIETTSLAKYIFDKYGFDFSKNKFRKRFVIVTDKGSPLDKFAGEFSLAAFHLPLNVGGRFSVLTAVGLLPLAILGYDVMKLLNGAAKMKKSFFAGHESDMVKKAIFYADNKDTTPINVLFSYSSSLGAMGAWYRQIWGESLGKLTIDGGARTGLTPSELVGSVDQHSYLQLIVQGPLNKSVTFMRVKNFRNDAKVPNVTIKNLENTNYANGMRMNDLINAQCEATLQTLVEQGVMADIIEIDELNEESIGALIFYFELLTSCAGVALGVNTYDQPGVEFGKQRLLAMLKKD
jgi:glucose-6-phosphate isomerase